jgi:hypothetical protein
VNRDEHARITPAQAELLDPHLDRLKDAFYTVQEAVQAFSAAGQQHDLSAACALTFFRQMRDDSLASLGHANSAIDSIARMFGTSREELEAIEARHNQNEAVIAYADGKVDRADLTRMKDLLRWLTSDHPMPVVE